MLYGPDINARGVDFTPNSDKVIAVGRTTDVWDIKSKSLLNSYPIGNEDWGACAVSPDGKYIATGDSLTLINLSDGSIKQYFPSSIFLRAIAYHPSGNFIACIGANDYKLQFWNATDGTLLREMPESFYAHDIAFDKVGKRIAVAGRNDVEVNIWDVYSGSLLETLNNVSPSWSVAFSPLDNIIATGDSHGTVRVWAFAGTWITDLK